MTPRRVAALAQALALVLILAPGPWSGAGAPVEAATRPAPVPTGPVLDAAGSGVGCQTGGKFKGPKLPKDPPWPPGTKPTPSPTPAADVVAVEASAAPSPSPTPEAGLRLVAADSVQVAQADATTAPGGAGDADIQPNVDAVPDVSSGRRGRFLAGIDVSHHNPGVDFDKVRKGGNHFVFVKATQDIDFIDPDFSTNVAQARAAGLATGAYHFFDYSLDGKAQADHFIDRLEAGNAIHDALPPVVDVECWGPLGTSTQVVSATRLRDFVDRVYERTGRLPIVYTSVYMWKQVVGDAEDFGHLPLWAACWGCEDPPSLAAGWDGWAFWQTGVRRVKGVGRLDGNVFSGDPSDLEALKLRPVSLEGGAPFTGRQRVDVDLGGRDALQMRTSPDGQTWTSWSPIRSQARAELAATDGLQTLYFQLRAGPGLRSPVFSDTITLDMTGPELSEPAVTLREGSLEPERQGIPVTVGWTARDLSSGLGDATVAVSCETASPQRTDVPGSAAGGELARWQADLTLEADTSCAVTTIGRDAVGNASRDLLDPVVVRRVPLPAAGVPAEVVAEQVAIVARRGPDGGLVGLSVDGQRVGVVDLAAVELGAPELVAVATLDPTGSHLVAVEPADGDPGSLDGVEGLVTLSRATEASAAA